MISLVDLGALLQWLYYMYNFKLRLLVCQVPFFVALDHKTKSVVVAIRGTMSLKDTITDMTAQTAPVYTELQRDLLASEQQHQGLEPQPHQELEPQQHLQLEPQQHQEEQQEKHPAQLESSLPTVSSQNDVRSTEVDIHSYQNGCDVPEEDSALPQNETEMSNVSPAGSSSKAGETSTNVTSKTAHDAITTDVSDVSITTDVPDVSITTDVSDLSITADVKQAAVVPISEARDASPVAKVDDPGEQRDFLAHKGMVNAANFVYDKLRETRVSSGRPG